MKHHLHAPDLAVFRRTTRGQQAVLANILLLDTSQRRVLLVVNGITSLTDLALATGMAIADFEKCASALLAEGLIEASPDLHPKRGMPRTGFDEEITFSQKEGRKFT